MPRGSCLCGGVAFVSDEVPLIINCHCSRCRKAHGAAFASIANVPASSFRFTQGEDLVTTYASPRLRTFCRVCGSNLPVKQPGDEVYGVPVGLFDEDPEARPAMELFVASKAPWWEPREDLPSFPDWVPGFSPDGA